MKRKSKPLIVTCRHCNKQYDKNDIKRQYGKDSAVYEGNFCSAFCYTKHTVK